MGAMGNCFDCGEEAKHSHHVVPRSLGGVAMVPLCVRCHSLVHNRQFVDIGRLTSKAMKRMKAQGEYTGGRPPYGFRLEGGRLVEQPDEQVLIALVKRYRAEGMTLRAISSVLAEQGRVSRTGRPFHAQTVARLAR